MADQAPPDDDASPTASSPSNSRYHLYAVLNVPRDASPGDIKRAYHALSRVLHPDKQRRQTVNLSDDEYAARNREYQSVLQARNVLSDPIQREIYDAFGAPGLKVFQEEMSSDDPSIFEVDENKEDDLIDNTIDDDSSDPDGELELPSFLKRQAN